MIILMYIIYNPGLALLWRRSLVTHFQFFPTEIDKMRELLDDFTVFSDYYLNFIRFTFFAKTLRTSFKDPAISSFVAYSQRGIFCCCIILFLVCI